MASFHLCNTRANFNKTQVKLHPVLASNANHSTRITYPIKLSSNTGNQSCGSTDTHVCNNHDNKLGTSLLQKPPLKIGIIGLGDFGQFLAKAFKRQGHNVLGTSRSDYSEFCQEHGIEFIRNLNGLCEAQPDVLLLCCSILSTEDVVNEIPFHKLKPNTILTDVLSVKQFPKKLFLDVVPKDFGILCTHPMFGKFSGSNSWEDLRFVYEKVRIAQNSIQEQRCEQFLSIFQDEGCRMVEMSCEKHDKYAAESQFITHTIARILAEMDLEPTPIDTKGYETLVKLTQNAASHSSDLYDGLYLYNVNSTKQIEKLDRAFETVKQKLFGRLRDVVRKQVEKTVAVERISEPNFSTYFLPSKDIVQLSSFSPQQAQKQSS